MFSVKSGNHRPDGNMWPTGLYDEFRSTARNVEVVSALGRALDCNQQESDRVRSQFLFLSDDLARQPGETKIGVSGDESGVPGTLKLHNGYGTRRSYDEIRLSSE